MRKYKPNGELCTIFKKRHTTVSKRRLLVYGNCGLRLLSRHFVYRRQVRSLITWIKWHLVRIKRKRRKSHIRRFYWLRGLVMITMSRKSRKIRMGKGKGKPIGRYCCLHAGTVIFELRSINRAAVIHLFTVLQSKLQARMQPIVMQLNSIRQIGTHVPFYYSCPLRIFFKRRFKYPRRRLRWYKRNIVIWSSKYRKKKRYFRFEKHVRHLKNFIN